MVQISQTFEHYTYPWDPELEEVEKIKTEKKTELENLILNRFDPLWIEAAGPNKLASFSFYFYDVRVNVHCQPPRHLFVDWRSNKLIETNKQIDADFFPDIRGDQMKLWVKNALAYAEKLGKIFEPTFVDEMPELNAGNITQTLHFTPDPKITNLVVALNRLKIYTVSSCEGHVANNYLRKYPYAAFPNIVLFRLLSHIKDWPGIENQNVRLRANHSPDHIEGFVRESFELLFEDDDLVQNQQLVASFAKYLESKIGPKSSPTP